MKNSFKKNGMQLDLPAEIIQFLESSYDGIFITDGEGMILYTNYANEKVSGYTKEHVLGKNIQDLAKEKWFSHSVTLDVLTSKKRETAMCTNYVTNKQVIVTGNPIFSKDGELKYVFNNIRDITDLVAQKKLLEQKEKFIEQQSHELEHLRALQSKMKKKYIVHSDNIKKAFQLARHVAKFDSTVLILGESGTGKEGIAEIIVDSGNRSKEPFIKINCGAIPENLLESELFGYEKGAFTGADPKGKIGKFELAQGGTILLDEIAELPLNLQVKLLRVLQEKEITRVGGTKTIELDVRVIAATNKSIIDMVESGTFREDLYYRLNVVSINVPSLRERVEDIKPLITHFLEMFNNKHNLTKSISNEVYDVLCKYSWPGNVRELENVTESLIILSQNQIITQDDLPNKLIANTMKVNSTVEVNEIIPLKDATSHLEKQLIIKTIAKHGSTRKAAEVLQVDQSTIVRKIKKYNIDI
ncbi:sigma-54 interaction domain-containing protein [Alkalibacter mobilis]|uniref:sigma-54 interaction domain-containing protein n=1 Tax=Alkalibacter mobilis TaxID=2787712 RepID=UPI00189FD6AD|nr:sigma 54-interacting transcriptional regulator [Alkalibacter mobilis]MBF7097786.1 sigma 54-interacting transcriptional regulator [Alkalibacter mobilis]